MSVKVPEYAEMSTERASKDPVSDGDAESVTGDTGGIVASVVSDRLVSVVGDCGCTGDG